VVWIALLQRSCGYCLREVDASDMRLMKYKGRSYKLPIGYGSWASPAPITNIIGILLEEVFKVQVSMDVVGSSTNLIKHVLGCTDAKGDFWDPATNSAEAECSQKEYFQDPPLKAWIGVEAWITTQENQNLAKLLGYSGPIGYQTMPGLYTRPGPIQEASRDGYLLSWWQSYTLNHSATRRYFTGVPELDSAIRNLSVVYNGNILCPDHNCGPGLVRPLCNASDPRSHFLSDVDSEGSVLVQRCEGGWWYSEACAEQKETCIPVVLGNYDWNMVEWTKVILESKLPFAVTWLGWSGEFEAVKQLSELRFLFYWWTPDSAFIDIAPDQVTFDEKIMLIKQVNNAQVILWPGLLDLEPRVFTFLRVANWRESDLKLMMEQRFNNTSNEEVACQWLKDPANEARWKTWIPPKLNDTIVNLTTEKTAWNQLVLAVGLGMGACAVIMLVCYAVLRTRHFIIDSPAHPKSTTGAWVKQWAGSQHQHKLREVPSRVNKSCFLVNASPFRIELNIEGCSVFDLSPGDFIRVCRPSLKKIGLQIVSASIPEDYLAVVNEQDWRALNDRVGLVFLASDWQHAARPEDSGRDWEIRYSNLTARKALPPTANNVPLGHMKLVTNVRGSLMVLWSPPHILRGVPVRQLEQFLCKVIDHPDVWDDCEDWDDSGGRLLTSKPQGSVRRSMYDACKHIVMPEAAHFDASYAEVHCNYGPAAVFISHVWAESSANTLSTIRKLREWVQSKSMARTSLNYCEETGIGVGSERDDPDATIIFRVYFCVMCNNQSRVLEELGLDVKFSPFTRVLETDYCVQVALVSPLLALNRKWCNYEFCLARATKKQVWMCTNEGIVQAGQVAPRTLKELAVKVMKFNCKDATCASPADSVFIDKAVEQMGGYSEQDTILKQVFRTAIEEAHTMLDSAMNIVHGSSPVEGYGEMGRRAHFRQEHLFDQVLALRPQANEILVEIHESPPNRSPPNRPSRTTSSIPHGNTEPIFVALEPPSPERV